MERRREVSDESNRCRRGEGRDSRRNNDGGKERKLKRQKETKTKKRRSLQPLLKSN